MGGGSNLLVADEGFPGVVLCMTVSGIAVQQDNEVVDLTAGAGEKWHALVTYAVRHGWAGIECLADIPGFVGATPIQNVGAYGQEVAGSITELEAFDTATNQVVTLSNHACDFSYRNSRFKRADSGRFIILKDTFRLRRGGPPTVRFAEVEQQLTRSGKGQAPTLTDVRSTVLEIRRRKSMLLDGHHPNSRSAGSFFINPVLTA